MSGKMAQEQLRFCREVIKELFKKVHESYAYVFYEPVSEYHFHSLAAISKWRGRRELTVVPFPQTTSH